MWVMCTGRTTGGVEHKASPRSTAGPQPRTVQLAAKGAVEIEARAQDLPVDRESLKTMLAASLRKHGVGKGGVLGEAMKQVA
mgnify:CR=1 FL=1